MLATLSIAAGVAALASVYAAAGVGTSVGAPESSAPLRIDCPALDTESRAAFEARARAEMALSPWPAGEIVIACGANAARVDWHAASGGSAEREVALGSDSATVVDSLLGAVHALRFVGAPSEPPPMAAPVPRATVVTRMLAPARGSGFGLGMLAGVQGEVWEGDVAGAVEAQVGLRLEPRALWALALTGGYGRGLEESNGVRARTMRVMLGVAHVPVASLEIELGAEWRALVASRSVGVITEQQGSTLGAFASLRYLLMRGRFGLAVGPHLGLLAGPMVVELHGNEIFRVPRFVTGLSIAGRAELHR